MGMVLTRLSFRKLRRSKGTYVGLYFMAIPFFAALYTFIIPQDFLHTNIKHEQGFRKDKHESLQAIQKDIESYLKGKPVDRYPEYTINSVSDVSYSDGEFSYSVELREDADSFSKPGRTKKICGKFLPQETREINAYQKDILDFQHELCVKYPSKIELSCTSDFVESGTIRGFSYKESLRDFDMFSTEDFKSTDTNQRMEILNIPLHLATYFTQCSNRGSTSTHDPFVNINEEIVHQGAEIQIDELMTNHEHLVNGKQLAATWALFWRMFYFSAITITTLGYGDIVPISHLARILVATESILGIILIGLFFNALTKNPEMEDRA